MRILVTRPEPGATQLAEHLRRHGHQALIEPMLIIRMRRPDRLPLEGVRALIATSRNGLQAAGHARNLDEALPLPIFTVGRATAALAGQMGFEDVIQGPGRASDLTQVIAGRLDPYDGIIAHLAGESLAFDLKTDLEQLGFRVRQLLLYSSEPVKELSAGVIAAIRGKQVDGVVVMSPRTAATYAALIGLHELEPWVANVIHFCMSDVIARSLAPLGSVRVRIAAGPAIEELLALVDGEAAQSS